MSEQIPEEQRAAEAEAELVAEVRVDAVGPKLIATVTVIDRMLDAKAGAREIELPSANCARIAESLSLVVGVLIEAGRGAPPPASPEKEPPPPPEPPPPEEPESPPEPPAPPPKRYSWLGPRAGHDLALGPVVSYGLVPQISLGAHLGWGVRMKDVWPFWLSFTGLLPEETKDGRARLSTAYGSLAVCPFSGERGALRGRICPSFSAGLIWAEGQGFLEQKRKREVVSLLGLELAGDLRVFGPLTVGLTTRADVPLLRTEFVYFKKDGTEPRLHKARWLTGMAVLTIGVRFR